MADDARGPPGALTPLIDPDMPLDISGNIDASSVNAEASPDVAALLAEADAVLGAVSDQLAEPSAASVSFASPARSPAGPVGSIAVSDAPLSPMTGAPQTPLSPTDTVFTAGTFGGTVLTPGSPSDDTLHDSWTAEEPVQEAARPSSRDKVRNVVRSGLVRGQASPSTDHDADQLAVTAAERAMEQIDGKLEDIKQGKEGRAQKIVQAEAAAVRGRSKVQSASKRYFMFRSRSRSASPGFVPPKLMRTKTSTSVVRGDMAPEAENKKAPRKSWFRSSPKKKKKKKKKKQQLFGSPPKKKGMMASMRENFAVLKENDTVVCVQTWDQAVINVDVLKPCKVAVLRQKVRQFIAKRDDISPEVEKIKSARHRYVLMFQGTLLQDADIVPKGCYGDIDPNSDQWPNKLYVARSSYRPPFEEPDELDVDSLPSEWSIGTGSVSVKPLEYEDVIEEEPDNQEELRRIEENAKRSTELASRRRGKASKNKSVASKMHPHSRTFDLKRELKLLRCPEFMSERLCAHGYDDRGSFAALDDDVLRGGPLYVDRKTRRKIVALAEIYRQQDLRDEAAPTNFLAKKTVAEKEDARAFQTGDKQYFGKKSEMNRHWAKKAYEVPDAQAPVPVLLVEDRAQTAESTIVTSDHPFAAMSEDDRSILTELSALSPTSKKKVYGDPRYRHVGHIGKFVPCFEEDGEPSLQDRIDVLLQPVAAGRRDDYRDVVDALVEVFLDVFAKEKQRDHILREFFTANDGKLRGFECIGTRPMAPKRFTTNVDTLGGLSIKLHKDEDRERSVRKFCVTLYQNVAGKRRPAPGSLGGRAQNLQDEIVEFDEPLKDPLQRVRDAAVRDRPPRPPRALRTKRLMKSVRASARVMLDDDDLPNQDALVDEGGRNAPRRYCCEKHAWRALGRVADLAEAHRDMACREVELAFDKCSTFSPSYDELSDFVGTLLERRAVVERNGQAWRDPGEDKRDSIEASGGYVEDDKSKDIKDMDQRAAQLVKADETAQDAMAKHLRKVDKGAREATSDFYKATAVKVETQRQKPHILEDDEDACKALVQDVALCLQCAERPMVLGDVPDACTYDPGKLAARTGAVAARLVVEQANPAEQEAVFELLRRRTNVVADPFRDDDAKVLPTAGAFDAWATHCKTVDAYLYYRDSFQLNDTMAYSDVASSYQGSPGKPLEE